MTRRILDLWQAPGTFRVVAATTPLYVAVGVVSLYQLGVVWLVGWLLLGALWWLESSMTVCRRCKHFDTWHCAGQAKVVARLFRRRYDPIRPWRLVLHLIFDTLMLVVPVISGGLAFGAVAAVPCAVWLCFSAVSALPRDGFSYLAGGGRG